LHWCGAYKYTHLHNPTLRIETLRKMVRKMRAISGQLSIQAMKQHTAARKKQ
jgi:hypothetical protein